MGSLKERQFLEVNIFREKGVQALDCRDTINAPRVRPEPSLVSLVSYPQIEI